MASQQIQHSVSQTLSATASKLNVKLRGILMENESVLAIATQTNMARWWVFPPSGVVVTNKRILFLRLGWFSFEFDDFEWEHVDDVHTSEVWSGATIRVTGASSKSGHASTAAGSLRRTVSLDSLIKTDAAKVYAQGQQMEHEWREKTRHRMMEEHRITTAGVVLAATQSTTSLEATSAVTDDPLAKLKKLKSLLDAELIDQNEFDAKRTEILSAL